MPARFYMTCSWLSMLVVFVRVEKNSFHTLLLSVCCCSCESKLMSCDQSINESTVIIVSHPFTFFMTRLWGHYSLRSVVQNSSWVFVLQLDLLSRVNKMCWITCKFVSWLIFFAAGETVFSPCRLEWNRYVTHSIVYSWTPSTSAAEIHPLNVLTW